MASDPKAKQQSLQRCEAWVVYMDIYGFKSMVMSQEIKLLTRKLLDVRSDAIKSVVRIDQIPIVYLLSDSIFLVYPVDKNNVKTKSSQLQRCIEDAAEVLSKFAECQLPLRGGISFGEVCYGSHTLTGKAVVSAVQNETLVSAPLVVLPAKEIGQGILVRGFKLYPVKPHGLMKLKLVFPQPCDEFYRLVHTNLTKYVVEGPYDVAQAWYDAWKFLTEHSPQKKPAGSM